MTPIIHLKNIKCTRNERNILDDLSWSINPGHHWALLGANGSGKTTLLKIVTGYEWPTEGDVYVLGQHYGQCHLPQLRKTIGWVSAAIEHDVPEQDTALDIVLSGLEASLGLYRDFSEPEYQTARQTLELVGGAAYAGRSYATLSQGERQRVLIARALVNRPALLILDEPCAGLDPAAREHFLDDLGRLTQSDHATTIVFVTHHIEEIAPWIRHVLVLKNGQSLATGPADQVITGPVLTQAFDRTCTVETRNHRYFLRVE